MVAPFTKLTTKKWVVLASKIDQLFIGIGITPTHINIHHVGRASVATPDAKIIKISARQ